MQEFSACTHCAIHVSERRRLWCHDLRMYATLVRRLAFTYVMIWKNQNDIFRRFSRPLMLT